MGGANKALLATVALAVTGCTADDGKLNVRAIADPISAASKRGTPMMVEGRAALALGNVGTALEAFRKALREQPDSVEALAGIAACYERMGRYDLSRVNYEAALAIAPNNPVLLNSFAASLQLQGRTAEANALRAEAAQTEAAEVADAVKAVQVDIAAAEAAAVPQVVAAVTAARPATPPTQAVQPAPAVRAVEAPRPAPQPEMQVVHTEVVGNTEWKIEVPKAAPAPPAAPAVTVAVPPARPAESAPVTKSEPPVPVKPVEKAVAIAEPAPAEAVAIAPAATKDEPVVAKVAETALPRPAPVAPAPRVPVLSQPLATEVQPRLERLAPGEVALLTRSAPAWRTEIVAQNRHSVTARFVPLKGAMASNEPARFVPLKAAMAASRPNVRLLNAARHQSLAARTRTALLDRGWRKIAIGDAAQVRARSIVLYPADRRALGLRVAAQFGFASAINRDSDEVLVLLGRDAASLSFRRAG